MFDHVVNVEIPGIELMNLPHVGIQAKGNDIRILLSKFQVAQSPSRALGANVHRIRGGRRIEAGGWLIAGAIHECIVLNVS